MASRRHQWAAPFPAKITRIGAGGIDVEYLSNEPGDKNVKFDRVTLLNRATHNSSKKTAETKYEALEGDEKEQEFYDGLLKALDRAKTKPIPSAPSRTPAEITLRKALNERIKKHDPTGKLNEKQAYRLLWFNWLVYANKTKQQLSQLRVADIGLQLPSHLVKWNNVEAALQTAVEPRADEAPALTNAPNARSDLETPILS